MSESRTNNMGEASSLASNTRIVGAPQEKENACASPRGRFQQYGLGCRC
jgi:hypothetical protein